VAVEEPPGGRKDEELKCHRMMLDRYLHPLLRPVSNIQTLPLQELVVT
jgi:hypothetical protein